MANPLEFVLTAKDLASEQFEKLGHAVEHAESKTKAWKATASIASAAVVTGLVSFAKQSIDAYSDAEDQQTALDEAYKKFPQLAHGNIEALREMNSAIQAKTGTDDDDLAGMESTLAMYKMNQKQIEQMAPLVVDYAAKTHKSMDQAAMDVGKAMSGQTKTLREVGINYKATGNHAKDFEAVAKGLASTVGGFAESQGKTASGQLKIMGTEFQNIQETVGGMLEPVLISLAGILTKVIEWMSRNTPVVEALTAVFGLLVAGIVAVNVAMWIMAANPVVLTVVAIVVAVLALVVAIVWLVSNWKMVTTWLKSVWSAVVNWVTSIIRKLGADFHSVFSKIASQFVSIWNHIVSFFRTVISAVVNWAKSVFNSFMSWWNGFWGAIGRFVADVWNNRIVNPIKRAISWISTAIRVGLDIIRGVWSNIWGGLVGIVRGVMNSVIGAVQGGINGAIDIVNGLIGAFNAVGGLVHLHINAIPHVHLGHFASGTSNAPGGFAVVGENGPEVMNVPRGSQITPTNRAATVRLHPEDIGAIGRMVYSMIQQGAYVALGDALGG